MICDRETRERSAALRREQDPCASCGYGVLWRDLLIGDEDLTRALSKADKRRKDGSSSIAVATEQSHDLADIDFEFDSSDRRLATIMDR